MGLEDEAFWDILVITFLTFIVLAIIIYFSNGKGKRGRT